MSLIRGRLLGCEETASKVTAEKWRFTKDPSLLAVSFFFGGGHIMFGGKPTKVSSHFLWDVLLLLDVNGLLHPYLSRLDIRPLNR